MRGSRQRAVYRAMERLTLQHNRPPARSEVVAETGLATQDVGRALRYLETAGYVEHVGGPHFVLVRTDDGRTVRYAVTLD